jgi:hypothetical protein
MLFIQYDDYLLGFPVEVKASGQQQWVGTGFRMQASDKDRKA